MNSGEFKGSGLDKITGKEGTGKNVPIWYNNGEYELIIRYVQTETKEFVIFNKWLYKKMPGLLVEFKREMSLIDFNHQNKFQTPTFFN